MAIHDEYARLTPFELTFPDPEEADALMERIAAEAEELGGADDLRSFMHLSSVRGFLQELRPAEAQGEAMHQYASLAWHSWCFHRAGKPFWLLGTHAARFLVDGTPSREGPPLPAGSGYLQLPQHLFWVAPSPEGPPESVDGFFWHRSEQGVLHVLMAMGIRRDRAGLGVVPVADAPWADAQRWLEASVRPEGDDFSTTLPGGELEGLYSLEAAGEALKLLARVFAHLEAYPEAVTERAPADAEGVAEDEPVPSRLSCRHIALEAPHG